MSFDLMVFEKTSAPNTYEDFMNWMSQQTTWSEDRDYSSIDGTSPALTSWFMEMKNTFSPLNGSYRLSDDEAFATAESENHLTDYSIGSSIIYASFGWSVAEEAMEAVPALAQKHGVGFFNPQTGEVLSSGMVLCKIRTESSKDKAATWEQIEKEISSIDSWERGTNGRESAFITMWFEENNTDEEFMQCMPNYPKADGFFKKLFGSAQKTSTVISSYTVEVSTGEKIYSTEVSSKDEISMIFSTYHRSRKLPDISTWQDTGII